jgi:hypothetical protein
MWDTGLHLAFHAPLVNQIRNSHDYLSDFNAEKPLYESAGSLIEYLARLPLTASTLPGQVEQLMIAMYEAEVVGADDVRLTQTYLQDLAAVGYRFPTLVPSTAPFPIQQVRLTPRETPQPATGGSPSGIRPSVALIQQDRLTPRETPQPATGGSPSGIRPSVALITRTFSGDKKRMAHLLAERSAFVNPVRFPLFVVLDDESPKDHEYGDCVKKATVGVSVRYEALPTNHKVLFAGRPFGTNKKYGTDGYNRQQWSTFYLDQQTDADIIGVIDADACFFSFLTMESFLQDGRIVSKAMKSGDHYVAGDRMAIYGPNQNQTIHLPLDFMWIDRMPLFFWRSTFPMVRAAISKVWKMPFDDAFRQFSTVKFSQFNIMSNLALKHQPDLYSLRVQGAVSVAGNRCRSGDGRIGCCRTFSIGCQPGDEHEPTHVMRYSNMRADLETNFTLADAHYANVHHDVRSMPKERQAAMRGACEAMLARKTPRFCA